MFTEIEFFLNYTIKDNLRPITDFAGRLVQYIADFFETMPFLVQCIVYVLLFISAIGILFSHFLGIYKNRREWKKHPQYELTFSYFCGSGSLQRKLSYKEAHRLLRDHRWLLISFAGLAFRLGNFIHASKVLMFACSLPYIPLAILGFIEMVLRVCVGTIWLFIASFVHRFVLFVLRIVSYVFIPVWQIIDKAGRIDQHCPYCYETFSLPSFKCHQCGKIHKKLIPSRCGILVARCECGCFFPSSLYTGRSKTQAVCPSCGNELYAANARQFSIQLVGGNSSGKTAFLAALQHLYLGKANEVDKFMVTGEPQNNFDNLENMYEIGLTEPSSSTTVLTYSFVHTLKEVAKHNLVIFDIADELILSGTYERNPRNLGFSDGIIFIIDPLSIPSVRSEYVKSEDVDEADKYSADNNTNELIIEFVHQFSRITGQASRKQNKIPVAVVINKVDIKIVKREIGMPKIKATYNANPSRYGNDISVARDEICREYLSRIGLDNTLNNLDGTFSNVRYFPVSALGHTAQSGNKFEPIGILAPFVWITKESASQLSDIFSKVYGEDSK